MLLRMLFSGLPAGTATPTGMPTGASNCRFGTSIMGGSTESGSGVDFVVPVAPPAQEEITSETTAMKNVADNPSRLVRFIIVQCHSEHLRDDPAVLGSFEEHSMASQRKRRPAFSFTPFRRALHYRCYLSNLV